jgi:hypothetical protein
VVEELCPALTQNLLAGDPIFARMGLIRARGFFWDQIFSML